MFTSHKYPPAFCVTTSYERLAHALFYRAFLDGYLAILSFRRAHCINVTTAGLQSAEQGQEMGDGETRYRKTWTVL